MSDSGRIIPQGRVSVQKPARLVRRLTPSGYESEQLMHHDLVLCVGEALMDVIEDGAQGAEHPGGSPANVAVGVARLGVPVSLATSLGDDPDGSKIARHLKVNGVGVINEPAASAGTSRAIARLGPDGSADYTFHITWPLTREFVAERFPEAALLHTGSIAAFLSPGRDAVLDALTAARRNGSLVTFDPNIRAQLIGDQESAAAWFEQLIPLCHVVKMSDEDAAWLYPGVRVEAVAARVLRAGTQTVAITRGKDGAYLASDTAQVSVPGEAVAVVDTIGAGDSFMSALIVQLLQTPSAAARLREGAPPSSTDLLTLGAFAVHCAAITVSRPGADPPDRLEAKR